MHRGESTWTWEGVSLCAPGRDRVGPGGDRETQAGKSYACQMSPQLPFDWSFDV